ncbi:putative abc transporter cdr4 protein [Neofusicoccum parvum UCRNP2]|uniref:Putative abc transporter cdr4 protein n=1 Tax=Botryosphaeria parva (strain UCR-NP2) TaxID=1287680 RepID=R1GKK6_BOTPV|nr:putative abc transporter cdr4 protein [Neofusicoccum parvum UCRNP2]
MLVSFEIPTLRQVLVGAFLVSIPFQFTYAVTWLLFFSTVKKNIEELWDQSRLSSSTAIFSFVLRNMFGMAKAPARRYMLDNSGSGVRAHPKSNVLPHNRIDYRTHLCLQQFLLGSGLVPLFDRFHRLFSARLERLDVGLDSWVEMPDFVDFMAMEITPATVTAMCGPVLLQLSPDFPRLFWEYNDWIPSFSKGLPRFLIPRAYAVRDKLLGTIKAWHQYATEQTSKLDTKPDGEAIGEANGEADAFWGSKFFRERQQTLLAVDDYDADAIASEDFGSIWGFNTNAILASIWATLDVFRDAELLERVRRDVELCRSGAGRLDIDKLLKRPLLQSIYAETLRLRVHVYISRFAEHEELSVGEWSIPKKSAVLVSTTPAHLDPDAWNTGRDGRHPVDTFWADRFLVHPGDAERTGPLRRSSEAGAARRRCDSVVGDDDSNEPVFSADNISGSWFPYGGGVRMCPGRQFAKREVLLTLALMASLFDVEHFDRRTWFRTVAAANEKRGPRKTLGVAFRGLSVHGERSTLEFQRTVGNYALYLARRLGQSFAHRTARVDILRHVHGLVQSGELLLVLGRPGSGCSTLLKTLAGETYGLRLGRESHMNYQGIPADTMRAEFRGEYLYAAENDIHFPELTVGETLGFAAQARAPRVLLPGMTRDEHVQYMRDVVMSLLNLSSACDTKLGNEFIRGVSGGERKRVSIAEAFVGWSPLQCWDNSTRGLDSSTALDFIRTLRDFTTITGSAAIMTIYQGSQAMYDLFDNVTVLYEGRQIFFGSTKRAKSYFEELGFQCPDGATTADFLTSLTHPAEARELIRDGCQDHVPRTPDEFMDIWMKSPDHAKLLDDIDAFDRRFPLGGDQLDVFRCARQAEKDNALQSNSPYTISLPKQVLTMWAQRPIVEKHGRYALYRPAAEALSSMICDLPNKVITSLFFNLALYFMTNLRRTPAAFFTFYLFSFVSLLTMSMFFRMVGSISRTVEQTMAPVGIFLANYMIYTGFTDEEAVARSSVACPKANYATRPGGGIAAGIQQQTAVFHWDSISYDIKVGKSTKKILDEVDGWPKTIPKSEKLAYVEEVIQMLEMEAYADAIVGVPGEGLNVEQRKRLTIAVEMAAKPEFLLFLAQKRAVKKQLANYVATLAQSCPENVDSNSLHRFAEPFFVQLYEAFFIGFSFWMSPNTIQGLQNQVFAVFLILTMFTNIMQLVMPKFTANRALAEARELPSKTYSWKVFILSNILLEIPWQTLISVTVFLVWYFPLGMYSTALDTNTQHERAGLMLLLIWAFMVFSSTFSHLVVAGVEHAQTAIHLAQLFYYLLLIFCGVLVNVAVFPGFWVFMYKVSPLTYLVSGMIAAGVANAEVKCSNVERILAMREVEF